VLVAAAVAVLARVPATGPCCQMPSPAQRFVRFFKATGQTPGVDSFWERVTYSLILAGAPPATPKAPPAAASATSS
jgi:hypothetical protein